MKRLLKWAWVPLIIALFVVFSLAPGEAQKAANFWKRVGNILSPRISGDIIDTSNQYASDGSPLVRSTDQIGNVFYGPVDITASTSLSGTITAIGSTAGDLSLAQTSQAGGGLTIPATLNLEVPKGATITVANATVITNNGIIQGKGTISFTGTGSLALGAGAKVRGITFSGVLGNDAKVTAASVTAPEISNCIFSSMSNGIEATSVTKAKFIDNEFITVTNNAITLITSNDNEISGIVRSPKRGVYLAQSNRNKINVRVYDATENSFYLYNDCKYNQIENSQAYNSNNYGFVLQTGCNYNRLVNCLSYGTVVDEGYNLYNSHHNILTACLAYNSLLNNFETAGGSSYNSFIGCESIEAGGDYGFALIAEVTGGGAGANCNGNKLIGCKVTRANNAENWGNADYFIGSATYANFTNDNEIIGCYGFSTHANLTNVMLRNDVNTILSGNYLYHNTYNYIISISPATAAGRKMIGNMYPNLATTGYDTISLPRVVSVTSSATPTPNCDITDIYNITALAADATFGAPTGTPVQGQYLEIWIVDNATARALAFNAAYQFPASKPAPTTTVISEIMIIGFKYNSTLSKWVCTGWS